MAVELATAYVSIVPSAKGIGARLEQELSGELGPAADAAGDTAGKRAGNNFGKAMAIGAGAALAAAGIGKLLGDSIGAASDLNETVSKSNTIFGSNAGAIEDWAGGAAKNIGQSKQEALDAAATFGNMFTQLGIGGDAAAQMSTGMVELASDFASFHNADISDVLLAQQAAFRGEYDALQRFVPTINAAAVEQRALQLTGKATTKELTLQDKALATNALMMEGAGDAAGDFNRTSDSLANRQRVMSAQWADLSAQIGTALIPIMAALVNIITTKVIPAIEWLSEHPEILIGVAAGIVVAFGAWAASALSAAIATGALAASTLVALAPFIAIGVAVAALTAGVIWAYQNWGWFREAVDAVASFLKDPLLPILQAVGSFIIDHLIPAIVDIITWFVKAHIAVAEFAIGVGQRIGAMVTTVIGFFQDLGAGAADAVTAVKDKFEDIVDFFRVLPRRMRDAAGDMFGWIGDLFKGAINVVIDAWNSLRDKLQVSVHLNIPLGPDVDFDSGPILPRITPLAMGGPATKGSPYLVGENGPELFVPDTSGSVVPQGAAVVKVYELHYHAVHEVSNIRADFRQMELLDGAF